MISKYGVYIFTLHNCVTYIEGEINRRFLGAQSPEQNRRRLHHSLLCLATPTISTSLADRYYYHLGILEFSFSQKLEGLINKKILRITLPFMDKMTKSIKQIYHSFPPHVTDGLRHRDSFRNSVQDGISHLISASSSATKSFP
jgi:hypothetical protein